MPTGTQSTNTRLPSLERSYSSHYSLQYLPLRRRYLIIPSLSWLSLERRTGIYAGDCPSSVLLTDATKHLNRRLSIFSALPKKVNRLDNKLSISSGLPGIFTCFYPPSIVFCTVSKALIARVFPLRRKRGLPLKGPARKPPELMKALPSTNSLVAILSVPTVPT
jgi:hypothetical protein